MVNLSDLWQGQQPRAGVFHADQYLPVYDVIIPLVRSGIYRQHRYTRRSDRRTRSNAQRAPLNERRTQVIGRKTPLGITEPQAIQQAYAQALYGRINKHTHLVETHKIRTRVLGSTRFNPICNLQYSLHLYYIQYAIQLHETTTPSTIKISNSILSQYSNQYY